MCELIADARHADCADQNELDELMPDRMSPIRQRFSWFPHTLALAIAMLSGCGVAVPIAETECAAEFDRRIAADMALTYEAFDQTQGSGFRRLADLGCWKEAGDLIEAYIEATGATRREGSQWSAAVYRAIDCSRSESTS